MRCADKGFDTHPDVIAHFCGYWYYPNDSKRGGPCKYYARCQHQMIRTVEKEQWAKELHNEYWNKKKEEEKA